MAEKKKMVESAAPASDKKKALETAMAQIERAYGKGSIMRLGDNSRVMVEAIPTYNGEMYLEKHRATYTSQSNNKNCNRDCESKLIAYEALLSCLGEQGDKKTIDELWKECISNSDRCVKTGEKPFRKTK